MYRIPEPKPQDRDHVIVVTVGTAVRGVHGPYHREAGRRAMKHIRQDYDVAARCVLMKIRAAS